MDELHQHEDVVGRDIQILSYDDCGLPLVAYPAVLKTPAQGSSVVQYDSTIAAASTSPNFAPGAVAALRAHPCIREAGLAVVFAGLDLAPRAIARMSSNPDATSTASTSKAFVS